MRPDSTIPDAAITIIGNTSLEWILCDFAGLSVGLRTVPVYASLLPEEVGYAHTDNWLGSLAFGRIGDAAWRVFVAVVLAAAAIAALVKLLQG